MRRASARPSSNWRWEAAMPSYSAMSLAATSRAFRLSSSTWLTATTRFFRRAEILVGSGTVRLRFRRRTVALDRWLLIWIGSRGFVADAANCGLVKIRVGFGRVRGNQGGGGFHGILRADRCARAVGGVVEDDAALVGSLC